MIVISYLTSLSARNIHCRIILQDFGQGDRLDITTLYKVWHQKEKGFQSEAIHLFLTVLGRDKCALFQNDVAAMILLCIQELIANENILQIAFDE